MFGEVRRMRDARGRIDEARHGPQVDQGDDGLRGHGEPNPALIG